jgi:hypothetical protein
MYFYYYYQLSNPRSFISYFLLLQVMNREEGGPIDQPTTSSTQANHATGRSLVDLFVKWGSEEHERKLEKGEAQGYPFREATIRSFRAMIAIQVTISFFHAIGGWLADRKKPDQTYYAPLVTLQYLSNIFNAVFAKHTHHTIIYNEPKNGEGDPLWYVTLRRRLQGLVGGRKVETGDTYRNQSDNIDRSLNIDIQFALIHKNSQHSYEMHAALICESQGLNRANENGLQCWHRVRWCNTRGCMIMSWMCEKTMTEKFVSLWDDWKTWVLSFSHAMACLWMVGNGRRHLHADSVKDDNWIFLNLCTKSDVSATFNAAIRSTKGSVHGLTDNHTSKGFRSGGADYILETNGKCY